MWIRLPSPMALHLLRLARLCLRWLIGSLSWWCWYSGGSAWQNSSVYWSSLSNADRWWRGQLGRLRSPVIPGEKEGSTIFLLACLRWFCAWSSRLQRGRVWARGYSSVWHQIPRGTTPTVCHQQLHCIQSDGKTAWSEQSACRGLHMIVVFSIRCRDGDYQMPSGSRWNWYIGESSIRGTALWCFWW